ncbi:MAG: hypothetical protein ACREJQ_03760 [bacterium]
MKVWRQTGFAAIAGILLLLVLRVANAGGGEGRGMGAVPSIGPLPPSATRIARIDWFAPYRDANAGGWQSNVGNRTAADSEYWGYWAPSITVTAGAPSSASSVSTIKNIRGIAPSVTGSRTAATLPWNPAGRFAVVWQVRTSAPIDHIDLRFYRNYYTTEQVAHLIEWPRTSDGAFPMSTTFNPLTQDAGHPSGSGSPAYVSYSVEAVAVDVKGRVSGIACAQYDVVFGDPHGAGSELSIVSEPAPGTACSPHSDMDAIDGFDDLPPRTVEIAYYTYGAGSTATTFEPYELIVHGTTGSITMRNHDVYPHHMKAVYTRPYAEDPWGIALGGVPLLDFGHLDPGQSRSIPIPAGVSDLYTWNLYDLEDPTPYHKHIKIRISTQGSDKGGTGLAAVAGLSGLQGPTLPDAMVTRAAALESKLTKEQLDGIGPATAKFYKRYMMSDENADPLQTAQSEIGGLDWGQTDVDSLICIIMMEASKSANEDLKAIMEQVKAINNSKAAMREVLQAIQKQAGATKTPLRRTESRTTTSALAADTKGPPPKAVSLKDGIRPGPPPPEPPFTVADIQKMPASDLQKTRDTVKNKLDSLSEMGEMESLRLQMAMDRMSKMMSTLSNLMKKMSDTAQGITQNLK